MTWAFSDESERANVVYFGLLIATSSEVVRARRELRALLLPGQRRVHTAKESPRRRHQLLDVTAGIESTTVVFRLRRTQGVGRIAAREQLVRRATAEVVRTGVTNWVLDDQDPTQAQRDRHTIDHSLRQARAEIVYDHRPSQSEPMLWAIDGVLWAIGAGQPTAGRLPSVQIVDIPS